MAGNPKTTSPKVAKIASQTLQNPNASKTSKTLAGSVLSNAGKGSSKK